MSKEIDPIKNPQYYTDLHFELMKFMDEKEFLGFCKGNIIKYLTRLGKKPNAPVLQDLKKCQRYLEVMIEHFEEGNAHHINTR